MPCSSELSSSPLPKPMGIILLDFENLFSRITTSEPDLYSRATMTTDLLSYTIMYGDIDLLLKIDK